MSFQVEFLEAGTLIVHQPRNHTYVLLFKTMVKKAGGGWEYGWIYKKVENIRVIHDEVLFDVEEEGELFTRAFSLFDDDWKLTQTP